MRDGYVPEIPAGFRDKVTSIFGEAGRRWLDDLPGLLAACVRKWRLRDCRVSKNLSINYLCFAGSPEYGEVVLKIGVPDKELYTEMRALELFAGRNMCRCYASDAGLGAMLLERILPGDDLTRVAGSDLRTKIAARLIAALPVPVEAPSCFPAVTEWADRAFARIRRDGIAGARMLGLVDEASKLFGEITAGDRPPVLLHGDLNHWNILRDGGGRWRAVDPKGAIGPRCWEAGRFVNIELELVRPAERRECLNEMTSVIGAGLGEPPRVVALCAFLDKVLGTCWSFEEHSPRDMPARVDGCAFLAEEYARFRAASPGGKAANENTWRQTSSPRRRFSPRTR